MATRVSEEQTFEADKQIYNALFKETLTNRRQQGASTVKNITSGFKQSKEEDFMMDSEVKELHVVWVIREADELMFYLDYVFELVKYQHQLDKPMIHVEIYLTGIGKSSDLTYMMSQTLFLLTLASNSSRYLDINFGRPDMKSIVQDINPDQVYYCGGSFFKKALNDICIELKKPFHPEDFDSGTQLLNNLQSLFTSAKAFCFDAPVTKKPAEKNKPSSP